MRNEVKKLDQSFSELIRLKYADEHTGNCKCYGCENWFNWRELTCGHYIKHGNASVRWNDKNALPLCTVCNGKDVNIRERLVELFGGEEIDKLEVKGKQTVKLTRFELELKRKDVLSKLDELK